MSETSGSAPSDALAPMRSALLALDPSVLEATPVEHPALAELAHAAHAWLLARRASDGALEALAARLTRVDPTLEPEAVAVRALHALESGHAADGLAHARRAHRLARTASPEARELALLTLARASRVAGAPLHAEVLLARHSSRESTWRTWELGLAGATGGPPELAAFVGAIERGDVVGLAPAHDALARAASPCLAADLEVLRALVDPAAPLDASLALAFARGERHELVRGVHRVGRAHDHRLPLALVVAGRTTPARRMLSAALPLLAVPLLPRDLAQPRTDSALAALALAEGSSLTDSALFVALYARSYEPHDHRSLLEVVLDRASLRMAGAGTLHRRPGTVALELHAPVAITDPRVAEPLSERALDWLRGHPRSEPRALADTLDVPVRTAQSLLGDLVADEVATVERAAGRAPRFSAG